jgi:hypothetical protein
MTINRLTQIVAIDHNVVFVSICDGSHDREYATVSQDQEHYH